MKKIVNIILLMLSFITTAQVGINTVNPVVTLDVVSNPATTTLDGIIAPRITGEQLRAKTYSVNQIGTLVYVTVADTSPLGQTALVTNKGYYYYDGVQWQPFAAGESSKWSNNSTNEITELTNISDGTTIRPTGKEFVVKDNGKVGIGISNPAQTLHLSSTSGLFIDSYSSTLTSSTVLRTTGGSKNSPTAILNNQSIGYIQGRAYNGTEFYNQGPIIKFTAVGDQSITNAGTKIVFQTVNEGALNQTDKMTIDDSGNVGIMETNPDTMLHIKSANGSTSDITLEASSVNKTESGKINFLERNDTGFIINYNGLHDNLYFSSKRSGVDTVLMTISRKNSNNTEGNVGIGIAKGASPVAKLEVNGEIKVGYSIKKTTQVSGMLRFNNITNKFETFNGSTWVPII